MSNINTDSVILIKGSTENVLYFLIIISVILLLVSSLYYRYYINKYGYEPFFPPSYIPSFIYPKLKKEPLLRSTIENNLDKIFFRVSEK